MAINYDVYGQPETWQDCYYAGGLSTGLATLLKASRAKIPAWKETNPDWTFAAGQLRAGIADGKLTYHEPIDKSICTIGMDPETSPFKSFAVWGNYPDTHTYMIGTADLGEQGAANSIFWFEANCVSSGLTGVYGNNAFSRWRIPLEDLDKRTYAPDGVNGTTDSTQNGNFFIAPFTEFGARAFLLQILVYVQNSTTHQPPYSAEPTGTWRTLDDWKNNYSDHTISGCQLRYRFLNSYTQSTGKMNYYSANWSSSEYRKAAAAFADEFKIKLDSGDDYNFYDYGIQCPGTNVGAIRLFGSIDGLYQWTQSLHTIALVPWYVNNFIQIATDYQKIFPIISYSDDIYETLLFVAAHFGVPFTPGKSTSVGDASCSFSDDFLDDDLYLPIIDENGITHGEYTHGSANATNSYYDFSKSSDSGYDPTKPPVPIDPNTYSNVTGFNTISSNAALTYRYVLDAANVEKLGDDLYTICDSLSAQDFENFDGKIKDEFLTQSPIDAIISLQRFPFEIPHTGSSIGAVQLGKTEGQAQGYRTFFAFNTILFTGISIFPRFGNCFLDYEPYTSYELYIPFCGSTKIRAADILGHTLNIQMQIDLITGSCTAYIMADSLVIETASGSCGIEQPLSGIDSATINSNILQGLATQDALAQQKVNQFGAAVWPTGIIKDVLNPFGTKQAFDTIEAQETQNELSLTHIEAPPHKMGAASPLLAWYQEFNARLMIYYPEGDVIDSSIPPSLKQAEINSFGRLKGFATFTPGIVSSFSGFTRGDIRADGIPCTASERQRIKSMFSAGVYL